MVYVVMVTPALVVNASFWSDVNLPPRPDTLGARADLLLCAGCAARLFAGFEAFNALNT